MQRRGDAGAVTVELLGELLGDRAAARILAVVQGGEGGSSGAVEDVDQEVGVEVLVLYGHHRVTQPGGGLRSGVRSVVQREDSVHALLGVTHARQRGNVGRTHRKERADQSGRDRPKQEQPPADAAPRGPTASRFARSDASRRRPRRLMRQV